MKKLLSVDFLFFKSYAAISKQKKENSRLGTSHVLIWEIIPDKSNCAIFYIHEWVRPSNRVICIMFNKARSNWMKEVRQGIKMQPTNFSNFVDLEQYQWLLQQDWIIFLCKVSRHSEQCCRIILLSPVHMVPWLALSEDIQQFCKETPKSAINIYWF